MLCGMRSGDASGRTRARNPAVLRDSVTAAITQAFFEELAEVGYGRMSVDSIVRRAGVGKAAVYRRWASKDAMAVALISEVALSGAPLPDTGSLRGDLLALLTGLHKGMRHPLASRIIPAVVAEAGHDPELERMLRDTVEASRRASGEHIVHRAVARGELPNDCDTDLALDLMIAPLYWRLLVRKRDLDAAGIERLADSLAAALAAVRSPA
jgi:AcrR family transcriptional regulator